MILAFVKIGLPPVIIVGGSSVIAFIMWRWSYSNGPVPASIILAPFLLTVAGLEVHMAEEYFTQFGPAMSRLFNITWTETSFLLVFTFAGPVIYTLTALGLYLEKSFAGFVAWFIFIGPGCAEFTHFIFPLLKPSINPEIHDSISHTFANGMTISNLPNYHYAVTGQYYFPGLYTALLPMIPGIYGIIKIVKWRRLRNTI